MIISLGSLINESSQINSHFPLKYYTNLENLSRLYLGNFIFSPLICVSFNSAIGSYEVYVIINISQLKGPNFLYIPSLMFQMSDFIWNL